MTESEFIRYTDGLFDDVMTQIDALSVDLDCLNSGNVFTIEYQDGTELIINRHMATQELWLAAKTGGYHFLWQQGQWVTRKGEEFFDLLSQNLSMIAAEKIVIRKYKPD